MKKQDKDAVKLSLLTIICNATQIYRGTIPLNQKEIFKKNLRKTIEKLITKTDSNQLKNSDIRNSIIKLASDSNVSIGATQKAINVYLKVYCIISFSFLVKLSKNQKYLAIGFAHNSTTSPFISTL